MNTILVLVLLIVGLVLGGLGLYLSEDVEGTPGALLEGVSKIVGGSCLLTLLVWLISSLPDIIAAVWQWA